MSKAFRSVQAGPSKKENRLRDRWEKRQAHPASRQHAKRMASAEPEYVAQTGEAKTPAERGAWIAERKAEAIGKGMTWGRVSYDPKFNLTLIEYWRERPKDEGEPRFQFQAMSPHP
jgi:hypothetical protein